MHCRTPCRENRHSILTETTIQTEDALASRPDLPGYLRPLLAAIGKTLAGDRNPTLANDPDLDYASAAEIQLLLDRLADLV